MTKIHNTVQRNMVQTKAFILMQAQWVLLLIKRNAERSAVFSLKFTSKFDSSTATIKMIKFTVLLVVGVIAGRE